MSITQILQEQSIWTWNIMAMSVEVGEMIREDAITSVNLAIINQRVKQEKLNLSISSFQGAHLEQEFGADWQWSLDEKTFYLVQAKRLDPIPGSKSAALYKINIPQLITVVDVANSLGIKSAYVFYNSMTDIFGPLSEAEKGCMFIDANVLKGLVSDKIDQNDVMIAPKILLQAGMSSWAKMFPDSQTFMAQTLSPTGPNVPTPTAGPSFPAFR